ncbi:hypothetical protein DdX_14891 [Ditylenchus destructor]|uniref:F-box domain-containing protein n=1 Tax=Ditylenchus destructor TaxID=166010 RepID=A0AAD4R1J1_9BILA|nr:hypothetical protein DdX_14891 [Ditylenchus destructor]
MARLIVFDINIDDSVYCLLLLITLSTCFSSQVIGKIGTGKQDYLIFIGPDIRTRTFVFANPGPLLSTMPNMNFFVFILFAILACGHLVSESASELVKARTVFIGRKNYKGELDMKNDDNDKIFLAQKLPQRNGFQDWILKEGSKTIGSVQDARVTDESKQSPFAPVLYTYIDGQRHSRMHRENESYVLEHLKPESHSSKKIIGKACCVFMPVDYSFSREDKMIVSFSRRLLSVVTKYAITMENGTDIKDNFATFVMFFLLQHGDNTASSMQWNVFVLREILTFLDRIDLYQLQLISRKLFNFIATHFNGFPCDFLDSIIWEPEHNAWAIYTTTKLPFDNPKYRLTCEELISSRLATEKFHRCYNVTIQVSSASVYNSPGRFSQVFLDSMRSVAHLWTYNELEVSWSDNYDVCFCESFAAQMLPMLLHCYDLKLRNPPLAILDLDTLYCTSNITSLSFYNTGSTLENSSFIIKLAESVNERSSFIKMNFSVFILFAVLACGHLASESASELVKTRTVFIGRKKYKGELDMKNDDNDMIFLAQKLPQRNGFQDWVLKEGSETIGSVQDARVTEESKQSPFAPVLYTYLDGQRHSRMHRENGSYILEHLKPESHSSNKTIAKPCCVFLPADYSFSNDGKPVVSFSRRWISVVTKYAITMEAGTDIKDNFATFVMFFLLQHGDSTAS